MNSVAGDTVNETTAQLLLDTFCSRRDVYARQQEDGSYRPVHEELTTEVVLRHLAGEITVGHYLLGEDSQAKLIGFDVDLEAEGVWMQYPDFTQMPTGLTLEEEDAWTATRIQVHPCNPREAWLDRAHPGRDWFKTLLRTFAAEISSAATGVLGVPTVTAYSGSKGVHVYALTGPMEAAELRAGAKLVLQYHCEVGGGRLAPTRGDNFWKVTSGAPWTGSVAIEAFPKQDRIEPGKLGNLMRLPLGRNLKSPDPCFFVDPAQPYSVMAPVPADIALGGRK